MRLGTLLTLLGSSIGLVHAIDNRLLFTIPAGETMDTFEVDFDNTCSTWGPAADEGLTFISTLFEPGDFSGKNKDTEARLVCSWYNASDPVYKDITFTVAVAEYLGATKTSD
ncbi:hypothetical protein B0H10DRAFT_1949107 [Mycena sp. CBHHK59/15]|nr:hypothetical protein B0H10DRAFT_1949107 [Mycena sp. CBHHK59/15]